MDRNEELILTIERVFSSEAVFTVYSRPLYKLNTVRVRILQTYLVGCREQIELDDKYKIS